MNPTPDELLWTRRRSSKQQRMEDIHNNSSLFVVYVFVKIFLILFMWES